jgi:hypothetical protein
METGQPTFAICNVDRDMELSKRLGARRQPIGNLNICFDPRPMPTQYTNSQPFPTPRISGTSVPPPTAYDTKKNFYGGDKKGPWSGFATQIDDESVLRNQFFALQKCEQSEYIPSSRSDMYVLDDKPMPPIKNHADLDRKLACGGIFNTSTRTERLNSECGANFNPPTPFPES